MSEIINLILYFPLCRLSGVLTPVPNWNLSRTTCGKSATSMSMPLKPAGGLPLPNILTEHSSNLQLKNSWRLILPQLPANISTVSNNITLQVYSSLSFYNILFMSLLLYQGPRMKSILINSLSIYTQFSIYAVIFRLFDSVDWDAKNKVTAVKNQANVCYPYFSSFMLWNLFILPTSACIF